MQTAAAFSPTTAVAPSTWTGPAAAVDQLIAIRRLRVVGNVLCIAGHPDDENTGLISWLVHHEGVRTACFTYTLGEGGQNLIGPERAPLLGLIRAQELLAARRVDGAEQYFGSQPDFGYSKSAEETLSIWNREEALNELVEVIRRFRPDVIVTRFSPDEPNTHGHHTASTQLALEAFALAADPLFPGKTAALSPWQATRVVWNWFNLGPEVNPPEGLTFLPIEIGDYDPLIGESYPEVAARSLSMHKTQAFGSPPIIGSVTEFVRVLAGAPMSTSIFDGIDRTWGRVPGGEILDGMFERAAAEFTLDRPHASVRLLLEALAVLDAMPDHPWKEQKRQALCETIAGCAALNVSARVDAPLVTPGSASRVSVNVILRSPLPLQVGAVYLRTAGRTRMLANETTLVCNAAVAIGGDAEWPIELGIAKADVEVVASLVGGNTFSITRPVLHSWLDPVAGERLEPVAVVPAITVNPLSSVLIVPDAEPRTLKVRVRASCSEARGTLRLEAPAGVRVEPPHQSFELPCAGSEQLVSFTLHDTTSDVLRFSIDGLPARELVCVDYPHIPPVSLTREATVKVTRFELARGGTKIGYIAGAGDDVELALCQVGYKVTTLDEEAIECTPLSDFDAIVTGIRAFNTHPRLSALMPRLTSYVEGGGTLVVQYNTNTHMRALTTAVGPYPITIGEDRVSEEKAEVTLREPNHPVFTRPNTIGPADFADWVQERGLCFGAAWDSHYRALISMHDKDEPARNGALLVASHGAGRLVYTGLAFFRQLPAGVPGAFRLFANLLAK